MKTLVIYDSMYGNTKKIAEAVAAALPGEPDLLHIEDASQAVLPGYELVVIGAPTHGGGPSDPVKAFLDQLQPGDLSKTHFAAFDTRLRWFFLRFFGFAAPKILRRIKQSGGKVVGGPGDFFVSGGEGPLEEGELARASAWAKTIGQKMDQAQGPPAGGNPKR